MKTLKLTFHANAPHKIQSDSHKIWIFAEDLSRTLGELGTLSMDDADKVADILLVTKIRSRHLGRCRQHIEKLLQRHFLDNDCEITAVG